MTYKSFQDPIIPSNDDSSGTAHEHDPVEELCCSVFFCVNFFNQPNSIIVSS